MPKKHRTKYRIYTTRALESAIDPLVTQKRNKRYIVDVRFVDDIHGPKHQAIRAQVIKDHPDFLLLVGDCDTVPGYPMEDRHVSPSKAFDSDSYYSTPSNSYVPSIPTGRISSNDPATVQRVCEALVSYPADSSMGWRQRVVLTGWIPHDPSDSAYQQDAAVQCLREAGHYLTSYFEFQKSGNDSQRNRWGADDSSKQGLITVINHGAAVVRYLGHGLPTEWFNIGDNESFTNSDVDSIHVNGKLPLVVSATCLTGNLDATPSFAEKLQEACQAIGVWSADTESMTYFNDRVTQAIFREIVTGRERCVGRILLRTLRQMMSYDAELATAADHEFFKKTFLMYRYLGDPDTMLAIPKPRNTTLRETSANGPALAASNDTLVIGWTGAPINMCLNFMRSTDGLSFSDKVTLQEISPDSPALCRFGSEFVVAWIGVGNHRINIMRSGDGQQWTDKITLAEESWSAPALQSFGNKLYLAWRGGPTNNRINILRSSDARTWQDKKTLEETTTSGPALAATASNLILVWRGGPTNNLLNVMNSSDGQLFRNKHTLSDTTTSQPAMTNYLSHPMLAWAGVGNRLLNVLQGEETNNFDDTQWGAKLTWPETCMGRPALAKLGTSLVCAWTGDDGKLNTMLYPVAL